MSARKPGPPLADITGGTLEHYNQRAEDFWEGTRDHDVSQNIDALLRHIEGAPPFAILDFGCGPGRDLRGLHATRPRGDRPRGRRDASPRWRASTSGCEVWQQDFLALDLPAARFDGIFANASLFHVPSAELPRVLRELHAALKPARRALQLESARRRTRRAGTAGATARTTTSRRGGATSTDAGFVELEHYYRPPGLPREQQPWLASVWRRG